jgi:UDP-2,3-diacylglucosamine hydrolase
MSSLNESTSHDGLQSDFLIVSDLHVGAIDQPNKTVGNTLEEIATYASKHNLHLVIAGDLFDWWMDYPSERPLSHYGFLEHWKDLIHKGLKITLIPGNHDYWIQKPVLEGMNIERESMTLDTVFGPVFVFHGDGFTDPSMRLKKPLLHHVLQNPWFISLYQTLFPPHIGWKLMARFSAYKRSSKTSKERLDNWAEVMMPTLDAVVAVCGHDHEHRTRKLGEKWYVNLGFFEKDYMALQYKNETLSLVTKQDTRQESWVETTILCTNS